MTFEENLKKLEEIVEKMDSKDTSLDEGLKLFDRGVSIAGECMKKLEESSGKVSELTLQLDKLRVKEDTNGEN
ncbi:MAG TPA: exodeoxyribonuclease VII small subunit [Candidatus Caccalectryoclostridium excrementigallinarum]|uniref:Exodeoxyribonuclease 7 small subunit n=1 Tax=Candidatus Caccalectryoclostridium excrementigallinarum TaxID=2840710 RepID=A0A9D1MKW5_9FIRM|nr:exodeoxyribonuclease VII small subunit [Candidatus Caccalectryoclostridium excrementigallinarum]